MTVTRGAFANVGWWCRVRVRTPIPAALTAHHGVTLCLAYCCNRAAIERGGRDS